jgi:hypothetical protein
MFLPAMLGTKRIALSVLSFLIEWWREVLIIGLVLGLIHAGAEIRDREHQIKELEARHKLASATSQAKGASTGQEAVTVYVERNEADRPVVERVVERVRNVCLRSEDPVRVPVPEGAGAADEAASRTQDDEDRAFAEAIADDLQACNTELNKLSSLQDWIRANSGG